MRGKINMKNIRHGDLALIGVDKLPDGLKAADTKVLMTGSHGNDHTFDKGVFYPKVEENFVIGYFVAHKGCKLYHPEHGERVKGKTLLETHINEGIYELKRQVEDTHAGMKPVID